MIFFAEKKAAKVNSASEFKETSSPFCHISLVIAGYKNCFWQVQPIVAFKINNRMLHL